METLSITKATASDRNALIFLLKEAKLPFEDLPDTLDHFWLARRDGMLQGAVGLEWYPPFALLRSMVVLKGSQGEGIGKALYNHLIKTIISLENNAIKEVYLITNTAAPYFQKLGFQEVLREEVPDAIRESSQFKDVCPASATVMKKVLL